MLFQSSWLLIIALATPAICAPQHNITITVPEGFSNHGDKHLFCEPTKWYHVVLFFVANYVSHAATVKARPGQSTAQTIMDFVGALFLPYSGLMRAVEMMTKSSKPGTSDLRKAANAGALCMVVKPASKSMADRYWRKKNRRYLSAPEIELEHDDRIPEVYLHNDLLPKPTSVEQQRGASNTLEPHPVSDRNIKDDENDEAHKLARYMANANYPMAILASVPSNAVFEEEAGGKSTGIKITSAYNGVKAAVAIGQVIFASITLYQARGDQIKRYGYAAYGLTVLPFLVMSITNLCVNIVSEEYPTMYCVESIDSDEAVAKGGHIVGAVGRLAKSIEVNATILDPRDCIFSTDRVEADRWYRDGFGKGVQWHWQARIQRDGGVKWNTFTSGLAKLIVIGGLGLIPIVVIAILTHFDAGESTRAQRAWLMTWLVLGCCFGPGMATGRPSAYRGPTLWKKGYYPLMAAGIGGMVVVAQMLVSYGWCTRFDDITN